MQQENLLNEDATREGRYRAIAKWGMMDLNYDTNYVQNFQPLYAPGWGSG
jgi:hypothetical protein